MTVSLKKEMQEMQEWITQAEEEYLESDFHYKTPEELHTAVEELKVCLLVPKNLAFTKILKYHCFRKYTPFSKLYFHQNNISCCVI